MGYSGETYPIDLFQGGFSHNPNIDSIPPFMMVEPSRNINLHKGGRSKRGGTAKVNSTAVSGNPRIMGMLDFILRNTNQFTCFATADGKIYKNSTTTIKTGLTQNKLSNLTVYRNTLYHTNGADTIQTWDGAAASTSNIANPASDWGSGDQPTQLYVHGRGNSERLWALGSADQPQRLYASANGSDNFVTGVVTFDIETGDGYGLVGMIEINDTLYVFGKNTTFLIDDTDASTANWGYEKANWKGGAAHHRLIVPIPNGDVHCMTEDGDIYSIFGVQEAGDYKAASLARPAFIDNWIREFIKISNISNFHGCYDPERRAVLWFMTSNRSNTNDICLPYFIDRPPAEAWGAPMENGTTANAYAASCSALVRRTQSGRGQYAVYTGDHNGFLWKMEESNANDDSAAYNANVRTPYIGCNVPIMDKHFWRSRVVGEAIGNWNMNVKTWVDNIEKTEAQISLGGGGAVLDSFVLDTDVLGGNTVSDTSFLVGDYGKRIQHEIYNNNVNETFFISQLLIHYKKLGINP